MGFLHASGRLWQVLCGLMGYGLSLAAGAAATAPRPHVEGLPLILCELAHLNQQFMVLTTHRQPHWPALTNMLLLWQEAALRLANEVIEGQQKTAHAACVGVGGGRRAAAGAAGGMFGTEVEQQQQGQGLPSASCEDVQASRAALTQLAASPALWAAAWAQLAAFCHGMYTWQCGKLKKAQPSSNSRTNGNSSSSSSMSSSKSSSIAGSSDLAGMFASLQLFPDHEQVAAVFDPGEISARIEALSIPAKGRPFSETALASALRRGFLVPTAFLDSVLTSQGRSDLCEGLNLQQGARESEGLGSRGWEKTGHGGSSSGRGESRGEGSTGSNSGGGSGGGRSSADTRAAESISSGSSGEPAAAVLVVYGAEEVWPLLPPCSCCWRQQLCLGLLISAKSRALQ